MEAASRHLVQVVQDLYCKNEWYSLSEEEMTRLQAWQVDVAAQIVEQERQIFVQ